MALPSKKAAAADGDYMARLLSASPAVILPLVFVYLFVVDTRRPGRARKKKTAHLIAVAVSLPLVCVYHFCWHPASRTFALVRVAVFAVSLPQALAVSPR